MSVEGRGFTSLLIDRGLQDSQPPLFWTSSPLTTHTLLPNPTSGSLEVCKFPTRFLSVNSSGFPQWSLFGDLLR